MRSSGASSGETVDQDANLEHRRDGIDRSGFVSKHGAELVSKDRRLFGAPKFAEAADQLIVPTWLTFSGSPLGLGVTRTARPSETPC